jgi:hypothetical protein
LPLFRLGKGYGGILMTTRTKRLIRNFMLELLVYGVLLVVYFLTVLRYLDEPLYNLFNQNLYVYAGAALLLNCCSSCCFGMDNVFFAFQTWSGNNGVNYVFSD